MPTIYKTPYPQVASSPVRKSENINTKQEIQEKRLRGALPTEVQLKATRPLSPTKLSGNQNVVQLADPQGPGTLHFLDGEMTQDVTKQTHPPSVTSSVSTSNDLLPTLPHRTQGVHRKWNFITSSVQLYNKEVPKQEDRRTADLQHILRNIITESQTWLERPRPAKEPREWKTRMEALNAAAKIHLEKLDPEAILSPQVHLQRITEKLQDERSKIQARYTELITTRPSTREQALDTHNTRSHQEALKKETEYSGKIDSLILDIKSFQNDLVSMLGEIERHTADAKAKASRYEPLGPQVNINLQVITVSQNFKGLLAIPYKEATSYLESANKVIDATQKFLDGIVTQLTPMATDSSHIVRHRAALEASTTPKRESDKDPPLTPANPHAPLWISSARRGRGEL